MHLLDGTETKYIFVHHQGRNPLVTSFVYLSFVALTTEGLKIFTQNC